MPAQGRCGQLARCDAMDELLSRLGQPRRAEAWGSVELRLGTGGFREVSASARARALLQHRSDFDDAGLQRRTGSFRADVVGDVLGLASRPGRAICHQGRGRAQGWLGCSGAEQHCVPRGDGRRASTLPPCRARALSAGPQGAFRDLAGKGPGSIPGPRWYGPREHPWPHASTHPQPPKHTDTTPQASPPASSPCFSTCAANAASTSSRLLPTAARPCASGGPGRPRARPCTNRASARTSGSRVLGSTRQYVDLCPARTSRVLAASQGGRSSSRSVSTHKSPRSCGGLQLKRGLRGRREGLGWSRPASARGPCPAAAGFPGG